MKKIIIGLLAALVFYASSYAQKGNNQIGFGADVGIPTGEFSTYFKTGFGGYVKALLGAGKSGQVTFTTGYSSFKAVGDFPLTTGTVPILLGYRANFNGFFAEPQLGYSINNAKFAGFDDWAPETSQGGSFMWGAGVGYVFNNKIEVGARYQSASSGGSTMALFGLRLGYNFSLNGPKKQ
jgi:hypothetical protein